MITLKKKNTEFYLGPFLKREGDTEKIQWTRTLRKIHNKYIDDTKSMMQKKKKKGNKLINWVPLNLKSFCL